MAFVLVDPLARLPVGQFRQAGKRANRPTDKLILGQIDYLLHKVNKLKLSNGLKVNS
jgi:hypothetical protein